nr:Hpt domain-containing protein [Methyloferula stellata]
MTLAASVRNYAHPPDELTTLRNGFLERLSNNATALTRYRSLLEGGMARRDTLSRVRDMAHSLAGAGGIYGFAEISAAASALEEAAIAALDAPTGVDIVARRLDHLLAGFPATTGIQRNIPPLALNA